MKNFRILSLGFLVFSTALFYGCDLPSPKTTEQTDAEEVENVIENLEKESETLLEEEAKIDVELNELESLDL